MAHVHATSTAHSHNLIDLIAAPFKGLWNLLITMSESNYRVKEVSRLSGMTDEELAKRGLTREGIVRHVFRDQAIF
ncbi:hypothetical protein [Pseudoruegeria sp. SK021]|uniref:hypothetical protein n=1 Tax=Pseudoruegeria sp. SK021 TaxID=1933035 RepID=UPI000A24ECF0|nr:hypothetical protein [Pseudoruegeria sp. SK021]OSP55046.1 hypothetical protein BV911_09460 [Pseudoruegeria sp. SK021]